MASVTTISGTGQARSEQRGIAHWMDRVVKELEQLRRAPSAGTVHDLRVAMRRCRSVAAVMEQVDPDACWAGMQKTARKLFRGLGALRDVQVMAEWVRKIGPRNDAIRAQLELALETEQTGLREAALRSAAKFDLKAWKKLEQGLRYRARLVPAGSPAAECLVLERYEAAKELHGRAMRGEKAAPWHKLRIGLKRFRYTTENFLPEHSAAWGENLKRLQDLLGDIHDLDVLAELVERTAGSDHAESCQCWKQLLENERRERLQTYRRLTLGKTSLWQEWRHGLPQGKRLERASLGRLRATARAMDPRPSRTTQVAGIARRLFESLARAKASPSFAEPGMWRLFLAASRLHGVAAPAEGGPSRKMARNFLMKMALPPGWTAEEWEVLTEAIRFHRGAEPKSKDKTFARLSAQQQLSVRGLAGVLRLARALRKCGVETCVGLRLEKSGEALILKVPNLADTEDAAVRLAAGKHMLETQLDRPLVVKGVAQRAILLTLPGNNEGREIAASIASD
jgi:CHAD domain-containing protein